MNKMNNVPKVVIMGAAGRDFHNFLVCFRDDPSVRVVAFTAAQIPGIENRIFPPELSGPLYPQGIPILPEEKLPEIIRDHQVQQVVFAYSDLAHEEVMHKASRALALGADFILLGPERTMLPAAVPVISVCAVRTGCGKSGVTEYIWEVLKQLGIKAVVIRHPMPYCDLSRMRVERFATMEDLDKYLCTVEEREEYEHLVAKGIVVYAGVDYEAILREAEKEGPGDSLGWGEQRLLLHKARPGNRGSGSAPSGARKPLPSRGKPISSAPRFWLRTRWTPPEKKMSRRLKQSVRSAIPTPLSSKPLPGFGSKRGSKSGGKGSW